MKLTLLFLVLLVRLNAANFEFAGYMTSPKGPMFVVNDVDRGTVSGWLTQGQSFHGYKVIAFDKKDEVLVLSGDDGLLRLRLKDSRVTSGKGIAQLPSIKFTLSADGSIAFNGEAITLASLASQLKTISTKQPELTLDLQVPVDGGENVRASVTAIHEAGSAAGFKKLRVQLREQPNKAPEPTPLPVTPPAAQESRRP